MSQPSIVPLRIPLRMLEMEKGHRHPVGHAVEHGDFNGLSTSRFFTCDQSFEDRGVGIHPCRDIGSRYADSEAAAGSVAGNSARTR